MQIKVIQRWIEQFGWEKKKRASTNNNNTLKMILQDGHYIPWLLSFWIMDYFFLLNFLALMWLLISFLCMKHAREFVWYHLSLV